jgi:glycosyltransferase involved in cell wall biosynthesis
LKELIEALEKLKNPNIILLCLGKFSYLPDCSFEIRCEGFVGNNRLLSLYYSVADYFVMPSFQESFGQTPIESLACGTPVVAFPCGIIPELVTHDNGVICDEFTVDSLAKGIKLAMQNSYDREIIRKDVLNRFSYEKIGKQYVDLYEKIAK